MKSLAKKTRIEQFLKCLRFVRLISAKGHVTTILDYSGNMSFG